MTKRLLSAAVFIGLISSSAAPLSRADVKGLPDYAKKYLEESKESDGDLIDEMKESRYLAADLKAAQEIGIPKKGRREIVINLPEQMLYAFNPDGSIALKSKVIIGKNEKPTPIFQSRITSTKFFPDWTAPLSITLGSLDSRVAKGMLVRETGTSNLWKPTKRTADGFMAEKVDLDGNPVGSETREITIRRMMNQAFLFYVAPGTEGPMGEAKFTSMSPYGVFLHGTNKPELFKNGNRRLSAGCIRVEKMLELVGWAHEKDLAWAEGEAAEGPQRYVGMPSGVPISMVYFRETNWDGKKTAKHPDIYGLFK